MGVPRVLAVALAALFFAACASEDPESGGPTVAPTIPGLGSGSESTTDGAPQTTVGAPQTTDVPPSLVASPTTVPAAPAPPPPDPSCAPGPDRIVTELADDTFEAVVVPDYTLAEQRLGDVTIPAVRVPGFTIPAHIIDNGCLISYNAPGGCLGAVEISSVSIPEVTIPGVEIDPVVVDGVELAPGIEIPPVTLAGASTPAVRREQTCEIETSDRTGGVPALVRDELIRPEFRREGGTRSFIGRDPVCVPAGCSVRLSIDLVTVPVRISSRVVAPELVSVVTMLDAEQGTAVVETPGRTSYTASADVLFDPGEASLRPDAIPALQSIVTAIREAPPDTALLVEGHTDSLGETAYNDDLARARAEGVAEWLVNEGGIALARITTVGFGETTPVAPNTLDDGSDNPEGRALNRRVVISVLTGDG
jgi:outer membrane protein OmpA-like peptidoglycan-associated protein